MNLLSGPDLTLKQERVHFYNLDVLRFIAAMMIVFLHGYDGYTGWFHVPVPFQGDTPQGLNGLGKWVNTAHQHMRLGVDFFFIISGFLITYLLLKEKENTGKIHIGKFYLRRILRIWPVYIFIVIISKWWYVYLYEPRPDYWWTITFLNNFQPVFTGNASFPFVHFWSVCIEEHFYLFWPILLSLVSIKHLPKLFMSVIGLSILFRIFIFFTSENWDLHISYNTLSKIDTLAIGSWIGWIYFTKPFELKIPTYVRAVVYATGLACLFLVDTFWDNKFFQAVFEKYIFQGFLVFWFMNYMFNKNAFLAFKSKNVLHYFGKISYGLYMYHNILILYVVKMIFWQYGDLGFWWYWVIFLGLTFALSILSYELVEKHILKLKDRFAFIKTSR